MATALSSSNVHFLKIKHFIQSLKMLMYYFHCYILYSRHFLCSFFSTIPAVLIMNVLYYVLEILAPTEEVRDYK